MVGASFRTLAITRFGSHFFSDLAHYVRSADLIQSLIDNSQNLDEYAFALGAAAHYGADVDGHAIAVNLAVPVLYPELRSKYGNVVTYGDNPSGASEDGVRFRRFAGRARALCAQCLSRLYRFRGFERPAGPRLFSKPMA